MTLTYFEEEDSSYNDEPGVQLGALMNWVGAAVSLALIGGLLVWGYQLWVRDVTGVPVVRALEGPMRVAPDDPGGERADYQDLSVTRVASEGAEEVPVDRVVLAPPPVELTDEDLSVARLAASLPVIGSGEADTALAPDVPDTPSATGDTGSGEPTSAIELAIAEALGQTIAAPGHEDKGVVRSSAPPARPVDFSARILNVRTASAPVPQGEVPEELIPAGTRLVQLGAFPTPEEARAAWDKLDTRFGVYLDGKKRVIQTASAGDSTFFRLRAVGFDGLDDARRFCAVLVAENANCIPVIRR